MYRTLSLLLLITACSASRGGADPAAAEAEASPTGQESAGEGADAMVMRTYVVTPAESQRIEAVLRSLLQETEHGAGHGRVEDAGDGKLVVVAPPSIHEGVAELVEQVRSGDTASTGETVEVTYWFVAGTPGKTAELDAHSSIAPALQEIVEHEGPMAFEVLETASVAGLLDEHSQASGDKFRVSQTVSRSDERFLANLHVNGAVGSGLLLSLQTRVAVEPGKLVVVGQSGFAKNTRGNAPDESPGRRLFYILKLDTKPAT